MKKLENNSSIIHKCWMYLLIETVTLMEMLNLNSMINHCIDTIRITVYDSKRRQRVSLYF